jgi:hypothetical protein
MLRSIPVLAVPCMLSVVRQELELSGVGGVPAPRCLIVACSQLDGICLWALCKSRNLWAVVRAVLGRCLLMLQAVLSSRQILLCGKFGVVSGSCC